MHKYDFEGRVAVVTGGAKGIGYACAIHFARLGATVRATDLILGRDRNSMRYIKYYREHTPKDG